MVLTQHLHLILTSIFLECSLLDKVRLFLQLLVRRIKILVQAFKKEM